MLRRSLLSICLVLSVLPVARAGVPDGADTRTSGTVPASVMPDAPAPVMAVEATPAAQRSDPPAGDQAIDRPFSRILQDIGSDVLHLATRRSLIWIAGAGAVAGAVHPLDDNVRVAPGEEWASWSEIFDPGARIGNSAYLLGGAAATYAFGRMTDRPRAAHVGRDVLRSVATSEIVVQSIKLAVRRDRPDLSGDNSFPSGHASDTFAAAVVFQRHLGMKWAIPTYLIAGYVAVSRLHENRHNLSDVVMGSGIGIASGMATTRHATPGWMIAPMAVRGGVALTMTRVQGTGSSPTRAK